MTGSDSFAIVVGVDGSGQSLAALDWAITEARLRRGRIHVITAWFYPPLASEVGDGVIDDSFRLAAERVQAAALSAATDAGVPVTGRVVENSPATALLHAAGDADLVVVGSRGHGAFAGLRLGSVSSQVAHHAPCSVLIVRPRAD
ncbi:universal stress protein [Cryobacterium tagatosivorans]|uniref:Universal stress protein n=1 Tax=Cryobacterium tagatosivorans TaxID=1259199 RepID=A0A4R8UCI1_9MICO|nr:universal stress protein [Cryobacterium tagatosivorans]TFB46746.1 universal stress protein [Cryobacterium tagatosivorans]